MKQTKPAQHRRATIESLENRALLSSNLMITFYGLNGAGDFAANWQDSAVAIAAGATHSTLHRYAVGQRRQAVKATLASIDRNHNKRIDRQETVGLNLRIIGLSYGAIEAINFARSISRAGALVEGFTLGVSVPVKALVTLDPVQSTTYRTLGVTRNVINYTNYYQQHGGNARIDLFSAQTGARIGAMTVADPMSIKGQIMTSAARTTTQTRFDVGLYAEKIVTHMVEPGVNGKIRGKNINHLTLPFYAYAWAVRDLTRV